MEPSMTCGAGRQMPSALVFKALEETGVAAHRRRGFGRSQQGRPWLWFLVLGEALVVGWFKQGHELV